MDEATASLGNKKKVAVVVVDFIRCLAESHRTNLWLFRIKFRSDIERSGLIGDDVVVAGALGVGTLPLSAGTVRLIGVLDSLNVGFSFRNRFLFLSGAVHRATIGCSIAVMKKAAKVSGSGNDFRSVFLRKKRRGGVLEDGSGKKSINSKSESIDMEKECLALGKPLSKINFSLSDVDDDVLLDALLKLPPPLKNLVNISACKSFTLDIGLNKAADVKIVINTNLKKLTGHSDQTVVIKEILVGTSTEAVRAMLSEFGVIKSIKMQLVGLWQKAIIEFEEQSQANLLADRWSVLIGKDVVYIARSDLDKIIWDKRDFYKTLFYTLPVETNAHDIWDFIGSVGGKTCSAKSLDAVMGTTPILRGAHLHWSYLGSAICAKCERLGHTFLGCSSGGKLLSGRLSHQMLLDSDKSRLVTIYVKRLAPVTQPVAFGGVHGFATLKHSFASLAEHVNKLAKSRFGGVWVFTSGLDSGYLGAGVVIVMDSSLARHVCKVSEMPGQLLYIKLLFKNKLSVSILGLYAASKINSLIAKTVNESFFIILGSDFNENGFYKYASFKKCLDLGLVNSLVRSSAVKMPTWVNSRGVKKTIDYMFISPNLINVVVHHGVFNVSKYFNTDYQAVSVFLGLSGFLDTHLIFLCKQVNRDHWKFDIKNANETKWFEFRDNTAANAVMFSDTFGFAFKGFDGVFTKESSRFHKLKLLISRLVKALCLISCCDFVVLLGILFFLGFNFNLICSALAKVRKLYHATKLLESKCVEESYIKQIIARRMESFELNKGHTIRSVLEHPFCKVVLDHLVVGDELILEPDLVKSKVDKIMEGWTRKREVVTDLSANWVCQFQPLDYVFNGAFSGIMCSISFDEMFAIVKNLPDRKAVGLFGISNELWKHCDKSVLDMLLVLLNSCLVSKLVSRPWKDAWTAHKILSKVFSDRIFSACSTFDVLCWDNFLVLKDTMTQSPIFVIGSVAYDSVGWEHLRKSLVKIKMCDKFIRFFGNIYNGRINRVITDFRLTDEYYVHDGLDQKEVFLPFFWHIFYDSLLYKVKRQERVCGYRLNSHFISKIGWVDPQTGLTSFLAADAFVNDTIWVGNSQTATQHILDVASEFFRFNNISINNNKTVAVSINCQVMNLHLAISGLPISIAKKGESHCYLDIFLLTKGLSKPNLAKAYSDVRFFVNLVLRKVISNKQFVYLVSAILFPIISYRIQFSFIPINIQAKSKSASVINFANSVGILGHLFFHKSHNLQVFSWCLHHSLLFPTYVSVDPSNNFLASMIRIFSGCDLSLSNSLACAFCFWSGTSMSMVLGKPYFLKCVLLLKCYGITFKTFKHWKRLDLYNPVPFWFNLSVRFLEGDVFSSGSSSLMDSCAVSNIRQSHGFSIVCNDFLTTDVACLSVYMDRSLCGLSTIDIKTGTAVFFQDINLGLDVKVSGLVSFILVELQAIALAFECVLSFRTVNLFSDSQAALDACKSESFLVNWTKVRGHSGVLDNKCTDALVKDVTLSVWQLSYLISEKFLRAGGTAVSGNSRHFVHDSKFFMVWHTDSHLAAGFTSVHTASFCTYFIKAFHHRLLITVCKCLYNKCYPSVICLFCGDVEISDHLLDVYASIWEACSGLSWSFSCILQLLHICVSNYCESVSVFGDSKIVTLKVVDFIYEFCLTFKENIWIVHVRHRAFMNKSGLIPHDGSIPTSIFGLSTSFSSGMVRLLGIAEVFGVDFGFHNPCLFFSDIRDLVSVHISM
ncbi:hypothetical protein G9A89_022448 [Geosiphon pyriformis]|nr:hypothetical protein G9A89_022448 [Geosiphon pyriformis]